MRVRRALLAAVAVALLVACGGGADDAGGSDAPAEGSQPGTFGVTAASTLADPWLVPALDVSAADDVPPVLVSDGDRIQRVVDGAATVVVDPPDRVGRVFGDGSGTVFFETQRNSADGAPESFGLVRLRADGTSSRLTLATHRSVRLEDVVVRSETTKVLYALFEDAPDRDRTVPGRLLLRDLTTGAVTTVADVARGARVLAGASVGGDEVVVTFVDPDTGAATVEFRDLSGAAVARSSPTDGAGDGPPFIRSVALSADGLGTATLEGPAPTRAKTSTADATGDRPWTLVVEAEDGERTQLVVGGSSLRSVTIDFDGRWALVSGEDADGPVEPLLVDAKSPGLPAYLLTGVRGEARFETAGAG